MKILFSLLLILTLLSFINSNSNDNIDLTLIKEQLRTHPNQTLQDIYKSCYQDEYGPGHIITNTSSTYDYLIKELESMPSTRPIIFPYERVGTKGNYVRVDIGNIQYKRLPKYLLFSLLIISANIQKNIYLKDNDYIDNIINNYNYNDIKTIVKTDDDWPNIWSNITSSIEKEKLVPLIYNYEKDKPILEERSKQKDKTMHHSELYNKIYDPHYRIIERKLFETYIYPYIKNN